MPPRYVYWTILIDGTPTAFRAATREELLPTLKQIQRTAPSAEMKWFARGRMWASPDEAAAAHRAEAARHQQRRTPARAPGRAFVRGDRGSRPKRRR